MKFNSPEQWQPILGATFVKQGRQAVLEIGGKTWTRYQLGQMGAVHPSAARHLNGVIQQLGIKTMKDLAAKLPGIVALKGTGATTLFVVMALLANQGLDPEAAYGADVTVAALKARLKKRNKSGSKKRLNKKKGADRE